MSHFKGPTQISQKYCVKSKNVSYKSCRISRGTCDGDLDFDLEVKFKGHLKVNAKILNGNPYFLFDILVAYLESFPKHYN